ncbi:MAG: hypothetical protein GPOALKHO_001299 [Sodalis sp.]|nr:MAG: hypothetical protein GPOALKHO_001299 [Sodalis sp.]
MSKEKTAKKKRGGRENEEGMEEAGSWRRGRQGREDRLKLPTGVTFIYDFISKFYRYLTFKEIISQLPYCQNATLLISDNRISRSIARKRPRMVAGKGKCRAGRRACGGDTNGNLLADGDAVTVIKDLKVKGIASKLSPKLPPK